MDKPLEPWCLIWKIQFGYPCTLKIRESAVDMMVKDYGWHVLIRDTDVEANEWIEPHQRNPNRTGDPEC